MQSERCITWKASRAVNEAGLRADAWTRADARAFVELVGSEGTAGGLFEVDAPTVVTRAPGRLDVMGGIADYSGSLVLQWPIAEATFAAAQRAADGVVRVVSLGDGTGERVRAAEIDCAELAVLTDRGYEAVGEHLAPRSEDPWAAYVIGVLAVLLHECEMELEGGMRVLVRSTVPEGKGVGSSAALEVASLAAMGELLGMSLSGEEMARLCQLAENRVVGAPCGIMDQMTAALGREGRLLALLCQPAQVQGYLHVPGASRFWGIDSGTRHAVSGSDYTSVRTGAFMGYRILCEDAGLSVSGLNDEGRMKVDDGIWGGYLANVGVEEYESRFAAVLPETMSGEEFTSRYGGTTDVVTRVDPLRTYAVRAPTQHPIHEHARVSRFAELLSGSIDEATLEEMGSLMYESHVSYSECGLGSKGTDRLVEMVRETGAASGLYGAKITGGGSGGTVAVLGRAEAAPAVESIVRRYAQETGHTPVVFSGSSPGAVRSGVYKYG